MTSGEETTSRQENIAMRIRRRLHDMLTHSAGLILVLGMVPIATEHQNDIQSRARQSDPNQSRVYTSDIAKFFALVDSGSDADLGLLLQQRYIDEGSVGVKDFVPQRIAGGAQLAQKYRDDRAAYESARGVTNTIAREETRMRSAMYALAYLYPNASFPDIYFVIGRFNSAGTASPNGLIIGAEMIESSDQIVPIIAHELVHFQQPRLSNVTLLEQSLREGAADFIGELTSGRHTNPKAHAYGILHEARLWAEFKQIMGGTDFQSWLYSRTSGERPADLGYFLGYRIVQALWDRTADKREAVRAILNHSDAAQFVVQSGYDPGAR